MVQQGRRDADQPLLLALACGATVEAVARQAGISVSTARGRPGDADFQGPRDSRPGRAGVGAGGPTGTDGLGIPAAGRGRVPGHPTSETLGQRG